MIDFTHVSEIVLFHCDQWYESAGGKHYKIKEEK